MLFDEDIILENELVRLRALQEDDWQHLAHFMEEEPHIWHYSLVQMRTLADLQQYIGQAVAARNDKKEYPFIVFDKKQNAYAGCTRFYDVQPAYKYLQLGYTWYGRAFRGTHVNRNCKLLLLELAFEKWEMERVEFRADNRNEKSKQAMRAIGCVEEGVLRNHLPTAEGGRRDSIILSILRSEWLGGVKENLLRKISRTPATAINLNNKTFRLQHNTANGTASSDTIFHYKQNGDQITAEFYGGDVLHGNLIARLQGNQLEMLYQMRTKADEMKSGRATAQVLADDDKLRLALDWEWLSGSGNKGSSTYCEQ
jgi:RimJ/RimL family protein N-acetyltransferase